ncbi:surfeit locus protein 6 [Aplochiton taeniatus]
MKMASLQSRDSYIQKLTSKVCAKQSREPRKRTFVPFKGVDDNGPKNKKKKNRGNIKGANGKLNVHVKTAPKPMQKPLTSPVQKGVTIPKLNGAKTTVSNGTVTAQQKGSEGRKAGSQCSPVDALRQILHEKIEASRGQGTPKDPSSEAVREKRAKRKMERERKKRKRKEFLRKKMLAEQEAAEQEIKKEEVPAAAATATGPTAGKRDETAIVFNKIEVVEERYADKKLKKEEKKKSVKGNLTPLTGKNYKQLLGRVEARKAKLEHLKETDEGKARVMEEKMKWTNVLYKAEGLKIKDDEGMLRASLKRKERMRTQRKKRWGDRSQAVVEKMKRGQDKRRRNLQKQKKGKMEKQKDRARKKGRVLPEDLKKASA